jgi:hypothetical protein
MFKAVSRDAFHAALNASHASQAFRDQYRRFQDFDPWISQQAVLHEGDLEVEGSLKASAFCTLVTGHLIVGDVLDLGNEEFDEGGLLIVVGNVECRHFIGHYGKCVFVDGDLQAHGAVINGFSDSSLSIIGGLSAKLFIGCDIWAEVGAGAAMDYGVGYCLPIGYTAAAKQAIRPLHSEEETERAVLEAPRPEGYLFDAEQFATRIRAKLPLFR